jgi:hypothetical protein
MFIEYLCVSIPSITPVNVLVLSEKYLRLLFCDTYANI